MSAGILMGCVCVCVMLIDTRWLCLSVSLIFAVSCFFIFFRFVDVFLFAVFCSAYQFPIIVFNLLSQCNFVVLYAMVV